MAASLQEKRASSNPFYSSALHIVKGAAVVALGIRTGRTTESAKPRGKLGGTISLKLESAPSNEQKARMRELVRLMIAEDLPYRVFRMERSQAEELYGDAMYDALPEPEVVTELRLVSLARWNFGCQSKPVVRSTAFLGTVELTNFKHKANKQVLEVVFNVLPSCEEAPLAEEQSFVPFPALRELIPDAGTEPIPEEGQCTQQATEQGVWEVPGAPHTESKPVVATLGPEGTCSAEMAYWFVAQLGTGQVRLEQSFEDAASLVLSGQADVLVMPAAYKHYHEIVFASVGKLRLREVLTSTPEFVLVARKAAGSERRRVTCHPSPKPLLQQLEEEFAEVIEAKSNRIALQCLLDGQADVALTNRASLNTVGAEELEQLCEEHVFGKVDMPWAVCERGQPTPGFWRGRPLKEGHFVVDLARINLSMYPKGTSWLSPPFSLADIPGFSMELFPKGDMSARGGMCSCYLVHATGGFRLKFRLTLRTEVHTFYDANLDEALQRVGAKNFAPSTLLAGSSACVELLEITSR